MICTDATNETQANIVNVHQQHARMWRIRRTFMTNSFTEPLIARHPGDLWSSWDSNPQTPLLWSDYANEWSRFAVVWRNHGVVSSNCQAKRRRETDENRYFWCNFCDTSFRTKERLTSGAGATLMLKGFCLLRSDLCPKFVRQNDKRDHIQSESCHLGRIYMRI